MRILFKVSRKIILLWILSHRQNMKYYLLRKQRWIWLSDFDWFCNEVYNLCYKFYALMHFSKFLFSWYFPISEIILIIQIWQENFSEIYLRVFQKIKLSINYKLFLNNLDKGVSHTFLKDNMQENFRIIGK